jgi:hypothetical protein
VEDYKEKQKIQNELHLLLLQNGIDVGDVIGEYNPRRVRDLQGLLNALKKKYGEGGAFNAMAREVEKVEQKKDLSDQERTMEINKRLNNFMYRGNSKAGVANSKARTIQVLEPELMKYYYNSADATTLMIRDVVQQTKINELFGKGEDLEGQIGSYLDLSQELTLADKRRLTEAIKNVVRPPYLNRTLSGFNSVMSLFGLNNLTTAIKQMSEVSNSIIYNGLANNLKGLTNDIKLNRGSIENGSQQAISLLTDKTTAQKVLQNVSSVILKPFEFFDGVASTLFKKSAFEKLKEQLESPQLKSELLLLFDNEGRADEVGLKI